MSHRLIRSALPLIHLAKTLRSSAHPDTVAL